MNLERNVWSARPETDNSEISHNYSQWATSNGIDYVPMSKSFDELPKGVYEIRMNNTLGLFFKKIDVRNQDLIKFPDTNTNTVITDIQKFWASEEQFKKHKLIYKRGILLYGPPGSGKSCTIQMVMNDVIDRGGIVISFGDPDYFISGMKALRTIHPDIPIVVIMEDIDSIIYEYSESEILNILDGTHEINKVVFLATTNYPEKLGERIINRPSRFDRRIKIGFPTSQSRKIYLEFLFTEGFQIPLEEGLKKFNVDLDRWVEDTDELTVSHIRELFIQTVILNTPYEDTLKLLKNMSNAVESSDSSSIGFGASKSSDYYN